MDCYFFISKDFEKIDYNNIFNLKKELDLVGLPKRKTSVVGTTCINLLNNCDKIIYILNYSIKLRNEPFYILKDYLKTELTKISKPIADIIIYELNNYNSREVSTIIDIQKNIQMIRKSLTEDEALLKNDTLYYEYYDKLIEDFQKDADDYDKEMIEELQEERNNKTKGKKAIRSMIETTKLDLKYALEKERTLEELPQLIENYIQNLISNIVTYKYYFDLYFGILKIDSFDGKSLDFFQSVFGLEMEVPKFYIYNSYEDYNYILPLKNLFFKLAEIEVMKSKALKDETVQNLKEQASNITKNLSKNNEIINCKLYEISSLKDILNVYLSFFIENNIIINQCENCGKYFIPESRSDEKYCNNPSPQNPNKTCKEYGAKKKYRDEIKSHPIKYEHNKTSQFYRMRINRTKNNQEKEKYEKKFNAYKENFEKKKKQYNSGKLKENDFVEWIIKQKEGVKNGSSRTNKK